VLCESGSDARENPSFAPVIQREPVLVTSCPN
jgi:hypothetical protein